MTRQITKGIKISVENYFEGVYLEDYLIRFSFGYHITIENKSNDPVQLTSRYWKIKDSLSDTSIVKGEGVVGKKPILNPGETHSYNSRCLLNSPFGAMKGYYNMTNLNSGTKFKVNIPAFKLSAPFALN